MDQASLRIAVFSIEIVLAIGLIFWLRGSVRGVPAPWHLIGKVLIYGAICALVSAYITLKYSFNLVEIEKTNQTAVLQFGSWMVLANILVGALVEELAKYVIGVFVLIDNKSVRRLSDVIIYMIIVGLGFALVEDALYLLEPSVNASYRLLSFYLHAGTTAIMGYSMGRFRYGLAGYRELLRALLAAISLHGAYNLATQIQNREYSLYLMIALAALISLQIFILFRKTVQEEYELNQRDTKPKKPTRLLNLAGKR